MCYYTNNKRTQYSLFWLVGQYANGIFDSDCTADHDAGGPGVCGF